MDKEIDLIYVHDTVKHLVEHTSRLVQKVKDLEQDIEYLKRELNGQTSIKDK